MLDKQRSYKGPFAIVQDDEEDHYTEEEKDLVFEEDI